MRFSAAPFGVRWFPQTRWHVRCYDANSQITDLTTPDGSSTLAYDHDGQITSASLTSESYGYDANGNRTSNGTSVNADNQLAADNTYTYTYDANGNLTSQTRKDGTGAIEYTWDYRNRLTDVTFEDGTDAVTGSVHYAYDLSNNRISKTVRDASKNEQRGDERTTGRRTFVARGFEIWLHKGLFRPTSRPLRPRRPRSI